MAGSRFRSPFGPTPAYSATLSGQQLKVRGHLHAAGKSIPVDLDATVRPVGDELEVEAETQANHHHHGMTWNLGMLRPSAS
ncbi:MAG: hypothetical protein ACXVHK_32005 [Solirubrobacteraceae bacterium]